MIKKLQTFINRCLRVILRVRWTDRVRNEDLWERAYQVPIEEDIKRRRWRWIGHTLRKSGGSISRYALKWNPQGKREKTTRDMEKVCGEGDGKDGTFLGRAL